MTVRGVGDEVATELTRFEPARGRALEREEGRAAEGALLVSGRVAAHRFDELVGAIDAKGAER